MSLERPDPDWDEVLEQVPESPDTPCSYFGDRPSRVRYFLGDEDIPPALQEAALARGFRRCGDTYYRPVCRACNLCISYRVPTATFKPSRSQRRVLRRNEDVECSFGTPTQTEKKIELYLRYQYSQHFLRPPIPALEADREFDPGRSLETMIYQMYTNPDTTLEIEMRFESRLVGFGIMDVAVRSTSLVYFVFDPEDNSRSLGTLNILKSIEWAAARGLDYVYLGYYIPAHPKMDYKSHFRPAEMLDVVSGEWGPERPPLRTPDRPSE